MPTTISAARKCCWATMQQPLRISDERLKAVPILTLSSNPGISLEPSYAVCTATWKLSRLLLSSRSSRMRKQKTCSAPFPDLRPKLPPAPPSLLPIPQILYHEQLSAPSRIGRRSLVPVPRYFADNTVLIVILAKPYLEVII